MVTRRSSTPSAILPISRLSPHREERRPLALFARQPLIKRSTAYAKTPRSLGL